MAEQRSFRLHIVNIVLAILVLGLGFLRAFLMETPDAASAAYEYGRALGSGFTLCLFAAIGSLIVWFISRRSARAANFTFGVLIVFGALSFAVSTLQSQASNNRIQEHTDAFIESRDNSAEEMRQASDAMFDELIANSSGDEQKGHIASREYIGNQIESRAAWDEAYMNFMDDRILDYTLLDSDDEMAIQKGVVKEYAETSGTYATAFESAMEAMRSELVKAEASPNYIEEFMVGFGKSAGANAVVTARFLRAHEASGNEFLKLMELMEANEWSLDENTGDLLFASDETDNQAVAIMERIMELEVEINELSDEVERRSNAAAQSMGAVR